MKQKIYQVDAFTDKLFHGNPAAICPLGEWLSDEIMQKIALENNLSETAFYVKEGDQFRIRWFTPALEVDLCGHATLATAFVIFNYEPHDDKNISFITQKSGVLNVSRNGNQLTLDFPADRLEEIDVTSVIKAGLNLAPREAFRGKTDYLLVFDNESEIRELRPDFDKLTLLDCRGVIVTAKGDYVDFVSRFFAPQSGIDEDPVTGSAHTTLTPFWAGRLGKKVLTALQLSQRGGYLQCQLNGERVEISGECRLYMTGQLMELNS